MDTPGFGIERSPEYCAIVKERLEQQAKIDALVAACKAFIPMCKTHKKPERWVRHDPDGDIHMCDRCHDCWLSIQKLNRLAWPAYEEDEAINLALAAIALATNSCPAEGREP